MQNEAFTIPIMNMLEKEYQNMFDRTRSLDTRASFLLSVLTAIMPLYFNVFEWNSFKECFSGYISFTKVLEVTLFFISLGILCMCFIKCFSVITSKEYQAPNINIFKGFNLQDYEKADATTNLINTMLMYLYIESINHNDSVVKEKANRFKKSIRLLQLFLFTSIVCIILTNIR